MFILHPFPPFFDKDSKILILGSFPSVRSREEGFFYGHPQNRFWRVVSSAFEEKTPADIAEKKEFLTRVHIALWDVIAGCEISGSSDSSIKNATVNDLSPILEKTDIKAIFTNGKAAFRLYEKFTLKNTARPAVYLPSTSPANAAFSADRLTQVWKETIGECLKAEN